MKTQTLTLSKTATIIKCCAITATIAFVVCIAGKVNFHQFINNLLDWQII